MAKLSLTDIANLGGNPTSAQNNINANSAAIEAALDNTLSRDGSTPNNMNASIDMNSNEIINLGAPTGNNSAVRLIDLQNTVGTGLTSVIPITFDNTGSVLTTGATKTYIRMHYPAIITEWLLTTDRVGSLQLDIWRGVASIPTIANTIVGSTPPAVVAGQFGHGSTSLGGTALTGWNTTLAYGDILEFAITSATTVQKAVLTLAIRRI